MSFTKHIERYGKRFIQKIIKRIANPIQLTLEEFDPGTVSKILVVRHDSRLGNLVLMSSFLRSLKSAFPHAHVDVLISRGYEEVLQENPNIDTIIVFEKKKARYIPGWYLIFIKNIRSNKYDLAIDVSNGHHFSFNNVVLTMLSGARFRLGYNRGDAKAFLNFLAPAPPENTYIVDAIAGLVKYVFPEAKDYPLIYYLSETDRRFADEWLNKHGITAFDSFFAIHPGGKGRKKWEIENFAQLIDRISNEIGVKIIVIGGKAERGTISKLHEISASEFNVLDNVTIGQMAAVIDRCDMFISGDTGPLHVAAALYRNTVGIFISSNFHVYGPRGKNSRIVLCKDNERSCSDVMLAIMDILGAPS